VIESVPAQGATVREAPRQVELRFNVRIEHALARASLRAIAQEPVALEALPSAEARTERLVLRLPALKSGAYEVRYQVLAVDGHVTQGVLRFRVLP
jgi:methionine-rich copper-binding protein CopC